MVKKNVGYKIRLKSVRGRGSGVKSKNRVKCFECRVEFREKGKTKSKHCKECLEESDITKNE